MRQIIFFTCRQWKEEIRKIDFWVVVLCEAVFFSLFFGGMGNVLGEAEEMAGICSVLPMSLLNMDFVLIILGGYIMIISDIFSTGKNVCMLAMRSDRIRWYLGQVFYSFLISITYFVVIMVLQLAFYIGHIEISAEWGSGVISGTAFSGEFTLDIPSALLEQNALLTFLCTLAFSVLLGTFLGMICCVCNMYWRGGIGTAICAGLVVLERICVTNSMSLGMKSPVGMLANYQDLQAGNIITTVIYFIVLTGILIGIGMYRIRKMDIS